MASDGGEQVSATSDVLMIALLSSPVVLVGPAAVDPRRRRRPLGTVRVRCGFPSPAEDYEDDAVDLNELLIRNEPATFIYRAAGRSMEPMGIFSGDYLIVDRSVDVTDGALVLAVWEGNAPACKIVRMREGRVELHSADPAVTPIRFDPGSAVEIYAIVGIARQVRRGVRAR